MVGTGSCCYNGENVSALDAKLNFPFSIKITADGSMYLADSRRVRVVRPNGTVQTVAGNGTCCFSGDGGPATSAQINVADIGVGPDGTVYIADQSNRLRMVRGGIITTIAGNGTCCTAPGDDGPASAAQAAPQGIAVGDDGTIYFNEPATHSIRRITPDGIISRYLWGSSGQGLSLAPDGALYFADAGAGQIYRVRPEGRVELVAGRGFCSDFVLGDGGPATEACLRDPWHAAADRNGVVYIADRNGARIRAVTPDGIIRTVAGNGLTRGARLKDVLPATSSVTDFPFGIAVHPDGMVYFTDWDLDVVWRIEPKLPGRSLAGDLMIPSSDSATLSVFNVSQHLRTVDTLTGTTLLNFGYDSDKRLTSVTDLDGETTSLERDASGNITAIVAPNGQRTAIETTNGLITAITDPASGAYRFDYDDGALLKSMTTPRGVTTTFQYDSSGRLIRDSDAAGGFQKLTRTGTNTHYVANRATAEGRTTTYDVEYTPDGSVLKTITAPTGEVSHDDQLANGQRVSRSASGAVSTSIFGPDPRFGMTAPVLASRTLTNGSLLLVASSTRSATLSNPNDLFSVTALSSTSTVNGKTWQSAWDAATHTVTSLSPMGRRSTSLLDDKGRVLSSRQAALLPVDVTYDSSGRISSMQQGTRSVSYTYDAKRYLATMTDTLHRTTSFARDALGRVTMTTLPDGRQVGFTYDADGNLTSVTPPSRPSHSFTPTSVNLLAAYTPPAIPGGNATRYTYNRDRQLTLVTRADASTVSLSYDRGRLATITTPTDHYDLGYASTGQLATLGYSGGASLGYTYDGDLVARVSWSGAVSGAIDYTYNNDFRLASENGVALTYDFDGLLTTAGALTLTHDVQNGLLSGTALGSITDTYTYNDFGELLSYAAAADTTPLYSEDVIRDDAGRITTRDETLLGGASHDDYTYDTAGRLQTVTHNGITTTYAYDGNGNRLTRTTGGVSEAATYDDQDRQLTRGAASYTYAPTGELTSKTDATSTTTYTYDAVGNLRRVLLPTGTVIDYIIDGQNRRVGKKVNGTVVAGWLYADQLRIVAELDGTGAVHTQFVYGSRSNVPDYLIRDGITYRILSDHLGSPRVVVDSTTGAIAETLSFDEYGNVTGDTNPGFLPFGFAGGLFDRDTGLVRFGARDYDPADGRWTAKDSALFEGGLEFYGYADDDPVNIIDVTGRSGTLAIFSLTDEEEGSFGQLAAGHSWIGYTPDDPSSSTGQGATTTYSTWSAMNQRGIDGGLNRDVEEKLGDYKPKAARYARLDDAAEARLMAVIANYEKNLKWSIEHPCSSFAHDAWQAATGEDLHYKYGGQSNPTSLAVGIQKANRGRPFGARRWW
jgi:RHS repeat-associated protein